MADIIRVIKSENFTAMSNYHLRDKRLSLKAVGLLSKLLSNADGYEVSIGGLAASGKDGRDAIRSGLNELMELGYVERTEQQRIGGKFTAGDYLIREVPVSEQDSAYRVGFTDAVEPSRKIQHKEILKEEITIKKEPPKAPKGAAQGVHEGKGEKAVSLAAFIHAYPRLDDIESVKAIWETNVDAFTALIIHNALSQQLSCEGNVLRSDFPLASDYLKHALWKGPVWKPGRFHAFWGYYPRGEAKGKAVKAWDKLKPDNDLLAKIARALSAQKQSDGWRAGIGIPYASTYLNQRRWEDEVRCNNAADATAAAATVQRPEVDAW